MQNLQTLDDALTATLLPKRARNTHKGDYGKAAIVAGSWEYTGAAYLSTAACLRSGAGYTALFTPKKLLPYYVLKSPEALLVPLNEGGRVAFKQKNFKKLLDYTAVAYGMGAGTSRAVAKGAAYLLKRYTGKLILDADALNALAKYFTREQIQTLFANKKCDVILTPHGKEFSRLSGESVQTVIKDGLTLAQTYAKTHGCIVLLKGATSVITDGARTLVNRAGTSGQAKAGSGDVLSGVLAGLCASGADVFSAGAAGAYLAGKAAELTARELGAYSMLATDVIARLGKAFLRVTENADKQRRSE